MPSESDHWCGLVNFVLDFLAGRRYLPYPLPHLKKTCSLFPFACIQRRIVLSPLFYLDIANQGGLGSPVHQQSATGEDIEVGAVPIASIVNREAQICCWGVQARYQQNVKEGNYA